MLCKMDESLFIWYVNGGGRSRLGGYPWQSGLPLGF